MSTGHDGPRQSTTPLRSVDDHERRVAALFGAPRTTRMGIGDTLGRALATEVTASVSLPGFDNSAMDGYAVYAGDIAGASDAAPVRLPVAQDIPAGRTDVLELAPGTAHRIMTGAPMPHGADAVIQVELTDAGVTDVEIRGSVGVGASVRRAGSDIAGGEPALAAGTVVGPSQVGLLAALGIAEVDVFAPVHVVVLSTGSELIAPGLPLAHGQIYESNGPMLDAAVRSAGGRATVIHFVPDDVDEFRARIDEVVDGDDSVDLILTSGGVSAGAYEVVKDALTGHGVDFVKVAMQPGMPQGSGRYTSAGGTSVPIITLPGNPVSAQVSFEIFVRPPMRDAMGLPPHRRRVAAALTDDLRSPHGRRQFRRGVYVPSAGGATPDTVIPIGPPSSHHLRFLASANALIDIPVDDDDVAAGTTVEVILLD